jgi:hypothetical protein
VTVEELRNPLPCIVSVNGPLPDRADDGERLVMVGAGLEGRGIGKLTPPDTPPPGAGLLTTTVQAPVPARSEALSVICRWLPSTNVTACGTVQNVTDDDAMKPLPVIVSVNGPLPDRAEDGVRLVIEGCGFGRVSDWTAIVTVFDVASPIWITTGTEFPEGAPAGTRTLT